jgi:hypothetical protein
MEFKKFSVGHYSYGIDSRKIFFSHANENIAKCTDAKAKGVTNFNFEDETFVAHLKDKEH